MRVAGFTNQQEVYVGSKDRNFRINEFLIVEDPVLGDQLGEVVEAQTYNRFMPMNTQGELVDSSVLDSLKAIGYRVDEDTIYIAKVRFLNEALYPIETGSTVRIPRFLEVKDLMVNSSPNKGLVLGVIKNTDQMALEMDEELKDILDTFEGGAIKKQEDIPYIFDIRSMHQYPHIGIFGGSGSGKSFGLRVMLEELMKLNIPTIVLDPHFEMDFSDLTDGARHSYYKDRFKCLQVGFDIGVKFENLSNQDFKNLLNSSGYLTDSMDNVVDIIFKRKDSFMSFKNRLTYLIEAQEEGSIEKIQTRIDYADSQIDKKGWETRKELFEKYSKTCPYSSLKGILWRLNRLDNEGIFSKDIDAIEEGIQLGKLVVIQGSTRILQVFSTYLLNNLYHKRRDYRDALYRNSTADYFPPFIVVTDEAHNFAPKAYDSPSKSILKEISQEGRKYGVFLMLATQRPTLLDETITAQLNTKFIFRTVRASDIQTIKEETDITVEESRRLPYLKTGDVFISEALMGRTIFSRIRKSDTDSPHKENPFDELVTRREDGDGELYKLVKDKLPINGDSFMEIIKEIEKDHSITYKLEEFEEKLDYLVDKGYLKKEKTPFFNQYLEGK